MLAWINHLNQVENLEIRKKCENGKRRRKKTKQSAMPLSQIRQRIVICPREIILRFEVNLWNLHLSWQFNSYSYIKASTEVLSNWAVKTYGDQKYTSRGFDPGFKIKTNTLPILMHQMRISTTQASSVMHGSKKLEIRKKCENWKSRRMKTKQNAMKLSQIR
jgi:hypothetical protein